MKEDNCITASNLIYIKAKRIISTKNLFLLDIYSALLHSFPSTLAAALTGPAVARLLYGTAREQIEWFVRQCLSSTPASFPAALTARLFSRPSGFNITPCHSGRPALRLAASCGGGERRDPGSSAGLRARKRRARPCRSGRDAAAPAVLQRPARQQLSAGRADLTAQRRKRSARFSSRLPAVPAAKSPPWLHVRARGPLPKLYSTDAYRTDGSLSGRHLSRSGRGCRQRSAASHLLTLCSKGFFTTFCRAPARTGRTHNESWTSRPYGQATYTLPGHPGAQKGRKPVTGQAASPGTSPTRAPQRSSARRPLNSWRMRGSPARG